MGDSRLNATERTVQPKFMVPAVVAGLLLLPVLLLLAADSVRRLPDRQPLPDRAAAVRFEPLQVAGVAGAWAVTVDDPRFGGVSALALDGDRLLALTDSATLVRLPRPGTGGQVQLRDLPDGPGPPNRRKWRDSEALLRDPAGGWWVSFENRHSLWRFDSGFQRALGRRALPSRGWAVNTGVEAMVQDGAGLLLLREGGDLALRLVRGRLGRHPLSGPGGGIADAARLPDGRVLVLVRRVGPTGLANWIGQLERAPGGGGQVRLLQRVAVGPLTNLEAMAPERLPSGRTRLWLMSDNDFSDLRRTLLLALDLPAADIPPAPTPG
jgi:hypothetical protein